MNAPVDEAPVDETPDAESPFATPMDLQNRSRGRIKASDSYVSEALAAATEMIRDAAGWHIWPVVAETKKLDGPGTSILLLPTVLLLELESITEHGRAIDVATLDASENGFVGGRRWSNRPGAIVATFRHGYARVPAALKDLALHIAGRSLGSPLGVTKEQAGGVGVSYSLTGSQAAGGTVILDHELPTLTKYLVRGRS